MKSKKYMTRLLLFNILTVICILLLPETKVYAATPVKVCAVSYEDESILVFNNSNSRIFYATETEAAKGSWDVINVKNSEPITAIDISFLSANVENIIMIKGYPDETQTRVIIKDKPQKLSVSVNYSSMESLPAGSTIGPMLNIMATEGTGVSPITFKDLQWKKGDDGHWMSTDLLTKEMLESYLIKGTYLYFRIAPVDDVVDATVSSTDYTTQIRTNASMYAYTKSFGTTYSNISFGTKYPNGLGGRRASNEVKLKIVKMQSLPVTGIDGEDFKVEIQYGQEYRVTEAGKATPSIWTQVTDRLVKKLPLSTMTGGIYDGLTKPFPQLLIEIRDYATSRSAASKIIATSLNEQRTLSGNILEEAVPVGADATNSNIYISYNGTKNLVVTIPSASVDNPYEYCVVKQGSTFDLERASWSTISKNTGVKILSSKALDYCKLYFRMKEVKYKPATSTKGAVSYKLASTYKIFDVNYPSMPTAPKMTHVYTKGYPTEIKITVTLNTVNKMPYETSLRYIKLGTKDVTVKSSVVTPAITGTPDPKQVYTMTIILSGTELEKMTNCTARALSIYYNNGTVDKTTNKLTIKNPTASGTLTTTAVKGTATGATAVTVVNALDTGNSFVYTLGATEVKGKNMEDTVTGDIPFTPGTDIAVGTNKYLTIYEVNSTKNIIRYKCIEITTDIVK